MNNFLIKFLANLITLFHLGIILFVILAPFSNMLYLLILHVSFCLSLLVHWYNNENICSLSLIESKLRNLDYTETFMHRIISPIYDISESELSKWCYIITITAMIISIYKIYSLPKTSEIIDCIKTTYKENLPFSQKLSIYGKCLVKLLEIS